MTKTRRDTSPPRNEHGRYVPLACPICDVGIIRHQGAGEWACDGLLDPGHPNLELQACWFTHADRQPYHAGAVTQPGRNLLAN